MMFFVIVMVAITNIMFFFFKHKTAYERLISDWSLDVCSSGLEFGLQLQLQRGGGDGDLRGWRELRAVEFVGDVDEVSRGFARSGTVAGQRGVRTAVQRRRMDARGGRAQRFEQPCGGRPAAGGFDEVGAERVRGVGSEIGRAHV